MFGSRRTPWEKPRVRDRAPSEGAVSACDGLDKPTLLSVTRCGTNSLLEQQARVGLADPHKNHGLSRRAARPVTPNAVTEPVCHTVPGPTPGPNSGCCGPVAGLVNSNLARTEEQFELEAFARPVQRCVTGLTSPVQCAYHQLGRGTGPSAPSFCHSLSRSRGLAKQVCTSTGSPE